MPISADLRVHSRNLVAHRSIGASVAEIVIDPEVPEAARRELEQASLRAPAGVGDPGPWPDGAEGEDDADLAPLRPPGVRLAAGAIVGVMAIILGVGLSSAGPFAA